MVAQFAGDPWVAPTRVLVGEPQHELAHPIVKGRTATSSPWLCPLAPHEFSVPAQKRLWSDQAAAPPRREQSGERRQQRTIGWPEHRTSLLPCEHDQLMPQYEQLDVFGELIAPAPDQQPEHSREGEIGERKEHSPILPSAAPEEPARSRVSGRYRLRSPARSGIRARS
jgi:hypothetical protein